MNYSMGELVPIVAKLSEGYTSKESSSISYETARQLMNAVIYCINECESQSDNSIISSNIFSAHDAYEAGLSLVKDKAKDAHNKYNQIMSGFSDYGNICLHDTIVKGMPEFFKWYNVKYNPQDTILTLDYPILYDISDYCGIDRIHLYIDCIAMEQQFFKAFPYDFITGALCRYNKNFTLMIDNICEIVLTNVLAHLLAHKNISDLVFTQEEYLNLQKLIHEETHNSLKEKLTYAVTKLVKDFYDNDEKMLHYLCCSIINISFRMKNAADNCTLHNLF